MDADQLINQVLRQRYRILNSLGSGAFGDTYLCEDLDLPTHPKCVVKHLKPKNTHPEVLIVARRLFENEAATLYRLGKLSNQIPKLLAYFEENGEFYLVQEFIDGYDLSTEIIPGSPWSESQVIKLLQEILQVLKVVHQQNIIHRDIKPQNLMRRRKDGKIMLIDFGSVKEIKGLTTDAQGQVTSTIIIGSNGYMPNEQANSKPKLCSDIYAVGVIGIQALTGKLPRNFPEDPNSGEIIWRNEANVSNRLADILTKMVAYNFSKRYQTAAEVLEVLLALSPIRSGTLHKWTWLSNNRKILAGVGITVGICITLTITLVADSIQKKAANTVSTENFVQLPCSSQVSVPSLSTTPNATFKDGTKYYGSLDKNNLFVGKGTMIFTNGSRYDGEFKNGKRYGCGRFVYPVNISYYEYYIGQFVNDKFNGLGKIKWKDGSEYRGHFRDSKCDGKGIFQFPDGSFKSGVWQNGDLLDSNISCNR
ncbi:protein kinase domain-containing protein [Sphaerospermopsis torques-reginae]|uniref:non-specific serine/threonine protein kinase n=1 Tax=Sphaerospermopsis torques-reginae ITEP-024 TaxID=984208 RepID=A0ABX8X0F9_9CYAN|nr:protein kinase [Sphaerospermopsis torques-reginae ITEP-024]